MILIALIAYATALVAANLVIAAVAKASPQFIPLAAGINAFLFIGLDLALRDWLHFRLTKAQMVFLIAGTGALTYALNPAAGDVAFASVVAFLAAAYTDWAVFRVLESHPWSQRSMGSNAAGAAVDSLIFPLLAWGSLDPKIAGTMFAAKITGSAIWAFLLRPRSGACQP